MAWDVSDWRREPLPTVREARPFALAAAESDWLELSVTVVGMGRDASDEAYVMGLCDRAVGEVGLRQHRFDWLVGDPGKSGHRVRLPVDGYWPWANLVVEYRERQHDEPVLHFDKPDRLTVSGVHRGAQRALYDARREELVPAHGIRLVMITPRDLAATTRGRLRRNTDDDLHAVRALLQMPTD
jgi:hypothetical protein